MRPGLPHQRFIDHEANEQHAAADQQRHHGARLQPVQPVALVETGIDHRNRDAEQQHAAPVGVAQQVSIDRFAGGAEIDHQAHQRRDQHALPIDPLPAEIIDIEADQRARRIEREADADRIDRDGRQPPVDWQVPQNDHQRRRHEGAEQHAMHDAERHQRRVIVHERDHQRDQGIDQARNAEHAAHPEYGRKPRHRRCDQDLRADARGRKPGSLVEAERKRAAQIRQADRRQPAVEIRQKRAEQYRADREQRPWRNTAARDWPAITVIFGHPYPPRRYRSW